MKRKIHDRGGRKGGRNIHSLRYHYNTAGLAEVRDRVSITIDNFHFWTKLNDICVVIGGGGGVCVLPRVKQATG